MVDIHRFDGSNFKCNVQAYKFTWIRIEFENFLIGNFFGGLIENCDGGTDVDNYFQEEEKKIITLRSEMLQ